jgi:hypothetical protein
VYRFFKARFNLLAPMNKALGFVVGGRLKGLASTAAEKKDREQRSVKGNLHG